MIKSCECGCGMMSNISDIEEYSKMDLTDEEKEAIKRFKIGIKPCYSTGICGSLTCGYGILDDYGYWEFPLISKYWSKEMQMLEEKPYIEKTITTVKRMYNPQYGNDKVCECGHSYYRHFDSYEHMEDVGCKYCGCRDFEEQAVVIDTFMNSFEENLKVLG